jgi:cellulase/cellobiase CelA1
VSAKVQRKYIFDTSPSGNGNPHEPDWCNVTDTKIGAKQTRDTGSENCIAFVHSKVPGESTA